MASLCMIFASAKLKTQKMRSSAKTKLLQDVRISPQQQRCTHFNNENDEPFPPAKVLQFSTSENSKQNLWWSTQYLSFPCCYSTTLEHSKKKSLFFLPQFSFLLTYEEPFLYLLWQYCWILLMMKMNIREKVLTNLEK